MCWVHYFAEVTQLGWKVDFRILIYILFSLTKPQLEKGETASSKATLLNTTLTPYDTFKSYKKNNMRLAFGTVLVNSQREKLFLIRTVP